MFLRQLFQWISKRAKSSRFLIYIYAHAILILVKPSSTYLFWQKSKYLYLYTRLIIRCCIQYFTRWILYDAWISYIYIWSITWWILYTVNIVWWMHEYHMVNCMVNTVHGEFDSKLNGEYCSWRMRRIDRKWPISAFITISSISHRWKYDQLCCKQKQMLTKHYILKF